MNRLEVKSFGPLAHADIPFGDLTVFVGPQATGKSLLVQLIKAVQDAGAIRSELSAHGFDWLHGKDATRDYCALYFGGGLHGLVKANTSIVKDGKTIDFKTVAKPPGRASNEETVFLVPAQRVLVLLRGWPQPFMSYSAGDPYCMRHFSDTLRLLMEQGLGAEAPIFPHSKRLKAGLKKLVDESIYVGARLELETEGMQKRIVLRREGEDGSLPYLAWSAGQREFTPLLLGLYWLLPPTKIARRGKLNTAVIEEPEMGLHPQAIVSFCLLLLELMDRGYRVIVSTHSPVVLDVVWAIRQLRDVSEKRAVRALGDIFEVKSVTPQLREIFVAGLKKEYRTYYFDRTDKGVVTRDISALDPGADDENVSGWGGLSGFSGRIADVVGKATVAEGT